MVDDKAKHSYKKWKGNTMTTTASHDLPGRAITPEQKQEVINRLHALWETYPELRLGQLLLNAFRFDFYRVEDFELIEMLEQWYKRDE